MIQCLSQRVSLTLIQQKPFFFFSFLARFKFGSLSQLWPKSKRLVFDTGRWRFAGRMCVGMEKRVAKIMVDQSAESESLRQIEES